MKTEEQVRAFRDLLKVQLSATRKRKEKEAIKIMIVAFNYVLGEEPELEKYTKQFTRL